MEQRSNDAAVKDAQIKSKTVVCARSMVQRLNYVAAKDAQTKSSEEECAEGMGYIAIKRFIAAFGSEFEMAAATQTLPNQGASRAAMIDGQVGSNVPREVAILCQEIVEV
eukprot:scaffold4300_cov116-Skeletonema_dohrnii-CCMP3373.AAC.6